MDDGREPEPRSHAHRAGHHQSRVDDRQHRPARHRREFSITGQCNAMGSRLFSNTTNLLGGHDFLNAEHRAKVARILDMPVERIPAQNSWAYDQILDGIADGKIKGLWVIAHEHRAFVDQSERRSTTLRRQARLPGRAGHVSHARKRRSRAHLVLPAAGWGEKEGTFINSERRIGLVKKVARAPGQALERFQHLPARRPLLGLRRDVPRMDFARGRVSNPETTQRRSALRHHRHSRTTSIWTNAAGFSGRGRRSRCQVCRCQVRRRAAHDTSHEPDTSTCT